MYASFNTTKENGKTKVLHELSSYQPSADVKECLNCSQTYKGRGEFFCSQKCFGENYSKTFVSPFKGIKKVKDNKECKICLKSYYARSSWKNSKYCSRECYFIAQKEQKKKERNRISVVCETCSTSFETHPCTLRKKNVRFCSMKCRRLSPKRSPLRLLLRGGALYKEWRTRVFERDDYSCQICKKIGGKLNADHIKPFSHILRENEIDSLEKAMNCMDLWIIENGRTLCVDCHRKTDTYGSKSHSLISKLKI